jgi:hypothetical protein
LAAKVELDGAADADVLDARPAQAVQRLFDGLALHVEDAGLQENMDRRAH